MDSLSWLMDFMSWLMDFMSSLPVSRCKANLSSALMTHEKDVVGLVWSIKYLFLGDGMCGAHRYQNADKR